MTKIAQIHTDHTLPLDPRRIILENILQVLEGRDQEFISADLLHEASN